ncbi:hypothetical protein [Lederbergia lenta]|uniref:hypothetical protein n=1 Tax=Lederbergia lenta TaxID=1467 RepID=UPI00203F10AA|nr:hypothetical protein [Lederbergia lenta]MCM3109913.1 hypothetical protein [Lederbergia lenta]
MEYKVKKDIEVTLKLTQEELNTIAVSVGATNQRDRDIVADAHNLNILDSSKSSELYSNLYEIAKKILL